MPSLFMSIIEKLAEIRLQIFIEFRELKIVIKQL